MSNLNHLTNGQNNIHNGNNHSDTSESVAEAKINSDTLHSDAEDVTYWRYRYEKLQEEYNRIHKLNQDLEEKLLKVVDRYERKNLEMLANNEHEKSTLIADVNKLSTKLVNARIRLHDIEEKEQIHASECNAPCHQNGRTAVMNDDIDTNCHNSANYDPNII